MLRNNQKKDLRAGWLEARAKLEKYGAASIRGPIGVVIDMLQVFGWTPLNYSVWHTHDPNNSYIINQFQGAVHQNGDQCLH